MNEKEITTRAIVIGIILTIILSAANVYLGLYAGMTVSASIPAAVAAVGFLRFLSRKDPVKLQSNIIQSMASAGEALAAGIIFTIPALVIVKAWGRFEYWPTTLIGMAGGTLGVIFMVPLRKALIQERPDLPYPEGVACANIIQSSDNGNKALPQLFTGFLAGLALKAASQLGGFIKPSLVYAHRFGQSIFFFGSDISAALLGVGYVVRIKVAFQVFLGGAIGWLFYLPLLNSASDGDVIESAYKTWSTQVKYVGVGAMLMGGLYTLWQAKGALFSGFGQLKGSQADDERNIPRSALFVLLGASFLLTLGIYQYLIGIFVYALVAAVVMIACCLVFVAIATYIVGLVGSSNSPVSGMTICALFISAGILLALGVQGKSFIVSVLGVAAIVCCATCTAGDIAQDLKTGMLLRATPARQQWVELIGIIVASLLFAPVLQFLQDGYGIADGKPGSLQAPQAALFANLARAFIDLETLPVSFLIQGALWGFGLLLVNHIIKKFANFKLHIMPVAVGIYLPLSISTPILLGGCIAYLVQKYRGTQAAENHVLLASGLIAGEAISGIFIAILAVFFFSPPLFKIYETITSISALMAFGLIAALFFRKGRNE